MMIRVCLFLTFMLAWADAYSQTYSFRNYSIQNGLSESVANDLLLDHNGYLWVATSYGINQFDGQQFINYYMEDGLSNNRTHTLFEDDENRIWIGTDKGINIFEDGEIHTAEEFEEICEFTILDIYQDSGGRFWFATDGAGVWHQDEDGELVQYTETDGLAGDRVLDVVELPENTFWFATRHGLSRFKDGNFETFTTTDGLPHENIRDLELSQNGGLWIGTRGGIAYYNDGDIETYTEEDGLVNNRIQTITEEAPDAVWIGTEAGMSFFDERQFTNYTTDQGLPNDIIYASLLDDEKNIWFGTYGGGISLFLGPMISNYTVEEGLPNNLVTSITQDAEDDIWISTYGGGLAKLAGNSVTVYNTQDGLLDNNVYTSLTDQSNRLWFGMREGFSMFEDGSFRNFSDTEFPFRQVRNIHQMKDDPEEFWVATYDSGLVRYQNGQQTHINQEDGLVHNRVMSIEEDDDGSLWFATYGGISKWTDGEFENFTTRDGLPNSGVLNVFKDDEGRLWFSTFAGLAVYENGTFETITSEHDLPEEICYFTIQDDHGHYWIGTNDGLVRFDFENYRNAENDHDRNAAFKRYTEDQGLISNEMNSSAAFKDREGDLWFGSVSGAIHIEPEHEKNVTEPPKVHIQQVMVAGELVELDENLVLDSNSHNISIDYTGISFTAPNQLVYEYRLRGHEDEWREVTWNTARFSGLLPGDYTFEVRARNSDGVWGEESATLNLTVLAPVWMRWWFIALIILGLAGIIYLIYKFLQVKKMVEIERMRVRIASDLHDDVGGSLTEIALQSDFLQTNNLDNELRKTLQHMGEQSRKIVSTLDDIVWSIDARNDTVGDLTDRMQDYVTSVLSNRSVNYEFDGLDMDQKLGVSVKENLYLIFKEAVNNIVKHSNATHVIIKLEQKSDGTFNLMVHDNGERVKKSRKTGKGLHNMKMRAKRINADILFKNKEGFTIEVNQARP